MVTEKKLTVCVIGSGSWGSVIAKIIASNTTRHPDFEDIVKMYVFDEIVGGRRLSDIINESHENIKYMPGYTLPENVLAIPSLLEAADNADILIFVLPHQFIHSTCCTLKYRIKSTAAAISLIKGFHRAPGGGIELISSVISTQLNIPCYTLMGANLANEVAAEQISEATLGCEDKMLGPLLKSILQTKYFRISVTQDREAVELCGALKNIVACGAGFMDGLGLGDNTKAATIRLGFLEMIDFVKILYPISKLETFLESCGIADLIATCYGGRNRKIAEEFVKSGKSFEKLEAEILKGQKLQGPPTAKEVYFMIKQRNLEEKFPVFVAVYKVCEREIKPEDFIRCLRNHPVHE